MNKPNISQNAQKNPPNPDRRKLLEATRMERLPSLPQRSGAPLKTPAPEVVCRACEREFPPGAGLIPQLPVCRDCLRIYALVDDSINDRAQRKNEDSRRTFEKWGERI